MTSHTDNFPPPNSSGRLHLNRAICTMRSRGVFRVGARDALHPLTFCSVAPPNIFRTPPQRGGGAKTFFRAFRAPAPSFLKSWIRPWWEVGPLGKLSHKLGSDESAGVGGGGVVGLWRHKPTFSLRAPQGKKKNTVQKFAYASTPLPTCMYTVWTIRQISVQYFFFFPCGALNENVGSWRHEPTTQLGRVHANWALN